MNYNLLIILFINILIILFIYYYLNNNFKKKLGMIMAKYNTSISYKNDIEFLNNMIEFNCELYENMVIKSRHSMKKGLLNDEEFNKAVKQIVTDILNCLGDTYKTNLLKYFNQSSLEFYITKAVFARITASFLKYNYSKIQQYNK